MNQFSFEYPWFLGIILLFIICAKFCKLKAKSIYFPHLNSLLLASRSSDYLLLILKWTTVSLAVVALASPVLTQEYHNIKKEGRDIVLIIDTSGSMQQGRFDVKNPMKNKFEVVQDVASAFVKHRKNDRIALVTFADIAFVSSPLTFEKKFLAQIIKLQTLGIAGQKTAIRDALVQSYAMLERSSTSKSKVAILLTDGIDNMSHVSVDDVETMISKSTVKLYTIGVGSSRDYDGKFLKALADVGKGEYFSAQNSIILQDIYQKIDKLETSKIEAKKVEKKEYLFIYPLLIAIFSLFLLIYFQTIKGRI